MQLTTLCYIEQNGCYLMIHRTKKQNDPNEGKWLGIGGHFEENESPEECMLREVREETGLTVHNFHFHGVMTFISDVWENEQMFLFSADEVSGTLTDCEEGDLKWIPKEELMDLKLWEGDRIFLKMMLEGVAQFNLKLRYQGEQLVEVVRDGDKTSCPINLASR